MTDKESIESSSEFLLNQFSETETEDWKFGNAKVHRGQLLSREFFLSDEFVEKLCEMYPNTVGYDMFAYDNAKTCQEAGVIHWIIVNAIDRSTNSKKSEEVPSKLAIEAATSLVKHVLSIDCLSQINCKAVSSTQREFHIFHR